MDSTSFRSFMEGTGGGNGGGAGRSVCSSGESHMSHFGSVGTLAKLHEPHTFRSAPVASWDIIAGNPTAKDVFSLTIASVALAATDDVGKVAQVGIRPPREHPHSRCRSLCANS